MIYSSLSFSLCGIIFTLLIIIIYKSKKKFDNIENIVYRNLLTLSLLILSFEIIFVFTIYNIDRLRIINEIICRIYLLLCHAWLVLCVGYISIIFEKNKITNMREFFLQSRVLTYAVLSIISFLACCLLPFEFVSFNGKLFTLGGKAFLPISFLCVFQISYFAYITFKNIKKIKFSKLLPLFILTIYFIFNCFTQLFEMDFNDLGFALAFTTIAIYLAIENQDIKLLNEFEELKEKAEELDKEKTEFLFNVSREIRIPMSVIMGFSDSLATSTDINEEKIKKDVGYIYEASNNLLDIINNILTISRIDSGKEKVDNKTYYVGNMLMELISVIDSKIDKESVEFVVNIDENTPSKLNGDEVKIYKILSNILNNAVKFTASGEIRLDVFAELNEEFAYLTFEISDTGCGIKQEDYGKLFKEFTKIEDASLKENDGTGLGLIITKKLVELLEGEISFQSEYGKGTKFFIKLKQRIVDSSKIGNINDITKIKKIDEQKSIDCSKYSALIVDDNSLNLKVAEKILKTYNFNVVTAKSGKECIEKIKGKENFDIVFLDHMMPEMDGIETIHILKKLEGFKVPPVIALTANLVTGLKEKYIKEGFDDYLSKPIDMKDLNKIIVKYFKNRRC